MARAQGIAGGTLRRQLAVLGAVASTAAVAAWVLGELVAPAAPPLATIAVAVFMGGAIVHFAVPDVIDELRARLRGYQGERQVSTVLDGLPQSWVVFHDVDLGPESADHVVISPGGVFVIETKNYFGIVRTTRSALRIHGRRNERIVQGAQRRAALLTERLATPVHPVVVFTRGRISGDRVCRLPVTTPAELPGLLALLAMGRLGPEAVGRIQAVLSGLGSDDPGRDLVPE